MAHHKHRIPASATPQPTRPATHQSGFTPIDFSRRKKRPFTLIELLVVITIIAVLAALLLPSLSLARQRAKRILCVGNVSQIARAMAFYTDDHDDTFPTSDTIQSSKARAMGKAGTVGSIWGVGHRMLNPYVSSHTTVTTTSAGGLKVFNCPSDSGATAAGCVFSWKTSWDTFGSSYIYNSDGNTSSGARGLHDRRVAEVRVPEALITVTGNPSWGAYYNGLNPCRLLFWHNRQENGWGTSAFADGHVIYHRISRNQPTHQIGPDWTFLYDLRP